jgi:serine/threonine protein kinase
MGVVFHAFDSQLDSEVAIKLLLDEDPDVSEEALARFRREVSLSRRIKHPNVARLHDLGVAGDLRYLVMEYIAGRTLTELVRERGALDLETAIPILRQVCRGVGAAHRAGILHRDLKPQNVMVDDRGAVAILDFGAALGRTDTRITQEGMIVGTPAFMSPEQLAAEAVDERSDLYSVGALAYFVVTGSLPFKGSDMVSLAVAVFEEPVAKEPLELARVPSDLAALILECLSKEPGSRPSSAEELEARLARLALKGGAAPYAAEPDPTPVPRPCILIVDDEPLQRRVVALHLGAAGCDVLEAGDGKEAVERLAASRVDLVLLDVQMPVMDGFDTLRVIRSLPGHRTLPVVLTSAFTERSRLAFAIQAGATDFLPKTLSMEAQVERVWKQLARDGFSRR